MNEQEYRDFRMMEDRRESEQSQKFVAILVFTIFYFIVFLWMRKKWNKLTPEEKERFLIQVGKTLIWFTILVGICLFLINATPEIGNILFGRTPTAQEKQLMLYKFSQDEVPYHEFEPHPIVKVVFGTLAAFFGSWLGYRYYKSVKARKK